MRSMNKYINRAIQSKIDVKSNVEVVFCSDLNEGILGKTLKIKKGDEIFYRILINEKISQVHVDILASESKEKHNKLVKISKEREVSIVDLLIIETFFHEMVHVDQFKSGRLLFVKHQEKFLYSWEGSVFKNTTGCLPYEVEAESLSEAMLEEFFNDSVVERFLKLRIF